MFLKFYSLSSVHSPNFTSPMVKDYLSNFFIRRPCHNIQKIML